MLVACVGVGRTERRELSTAVVPDRVCSAVCESEHDVLYISLHDTQRTKKGRDFIMYEYWSARTCRSSNNSGSSSVLQWLDTNGPCWFSLSPLADLQRR